MIGRRRTGSVSLDHLIALNDEIAALVRAGIPLEKGLTQIGDDSPGKLGVLASRLADRMNAGESLAEILQKDDAGFPPVWRSVVLAGIRSNHLAAALESLSRTGRRAKELRTTMALALIYPTIVVGLAFALFFFAMTSLVPIMAQTSQELTGTLDPFLATMTEFRKTMDFWGIVLPALCVLTFLCWWIRSGRAIRAFHGGGGPRFLFRRHRRRRLPSVRQSIVDGRLATFAEVLRLLDKHDVPMPEAVVLAADASGDRALSGAARTIAQRIEKGETFKRREDIPSAMPPLLGWSIVSGSGQSSLQRTLATSAEMYRQRSLHAARWASVYLPMVLTVFVGGGAVLGQSIVIFVPFLNLLYQLAG